MDVGSIELDIPEDKQTLEMGKSVYRYHIEHSAYDGDKSVEQLHAYRQFRDRLYDKNRFMIFEKVTHAIADAAADSAAPTLQQVQYDHRNDEHVVRDPEGLSKFIAGLEGARKMLEFEDGIDEVRDRKIERGINIIRFAKKRGYGIHYG